MADRISNLPDAILCHILSFLPTKQAAATSLVSKRWKPLWRFVLTLDFDDAHYVQSQEIHHFDSGNYAEQKETYSGFVRSVSAVLQLRHSDQPIQKFRLRCSSAEFYDPTHACEWIHTALQRRVEHLHISLSPNWRGRVSWGTPDIQPPNWFWFWRRDPITPIINCTTLVVLNLEELILQPPSSAYFPSLQILLMKNVGFSDASCVSKFLSGCPILKELNLNTILYKGVSRYIYGYVSIINCGTLAVLKLKNLEMQTSLSPLEMETSSSPYFPSLKILHMENLCIDDLLGLSKFLSGCPNLQDLKTNGYIHWKCEGGEIEILPKLIRASIREDHVFLLKAITNAKFVHITERLSLHQNQQL